MASLEWLFDTAGLKHLCDLDVLLFFARHPDALMTSEQLAAFVGYDLAQIANSLDLLVERQLLLRSQNPTHSARLYRFRPQNGGQWLTEILRVASTVEGRRHLRQLLRRRQTAPAGTPSQPPGGSPWNRSAEQENDHA